MEKNINNFIFSINGLMTKFDDVENQNDIAYEKLSSLISSIHSYNDDAEVYFLIDEINENDNKNCQKEKIKKFLKFFKIKIKENNINFLYVNVDSNSKDDQFILDDIANTNNKNSFKNIDTAIICSDYDFGETTYLEYYYTIFIYSKSNAYNNGKVNLKDIEKFSNILFEIDDEDMNIDNIDYDFISFLESNNIDD